ncbi:MAG: GNAT family N-acetyltransferase [Gammaproteobacteria bacterium]
MAGHGLSLDLASLERLYGRLITEPDGVMFVSVDGAVTGAIGGFLAKACFNENEAVAQETFWYVTPKARGSGAGRDLLEAFMQWSKAVGATSTVMATVGAPEGPTNLKLDGMYKALGFGPLETHYFRAAR